MKDCIAKNKQASSPGAYCASIHKAITGKWPAEREKFSYPEKLETIRIEQMIPARKDNSKTMEQAIDKKLMKKIAKDLNKEHRKNDVGNGDLLTDQELVGEAVNMGTDNYSDNPMQKEVGVKGMKWGHHKSKAQMDKHLDKLKTIRTKDQLGAIRAQATNDLSAGRLTPDHYRQVMEDTKKRAKSGLRNESKHSEDMTTATAGGAVAIGLLGPPKKKKEIFREEKEENTRYYTRLEKLREQLEDEKKLKEQRK